MNTFCWRGLELPYFDHEYNRTALNMRRIEVPIVRWYLKRAQRTHWFLRILEVGNVLSHYGPVGWPVVDLLEPGCINMDIRDYTPDKPIDLLISISTLEHISKEPTTNIRCLRALLAPNGLGVATVPLRFNRHLDRRLADGISGASAVYAMRKIKGGEQWAECTLDEGLEAGLDRSNGKWRNGMAVLELRPLEQQVAAVSIYHGNLMAAPG